MNAMKALAALLLVGCGSPLPGEPVHHAGQDEAIAVAWGMYGRTDPPPQVLWVEQLNCHNEWFAGFSWQGAGTVASGCVDGVTVEPDAVSVAWHPEGLAYWHLGLAHELQHAALMRACTRGPDFDCGDWRHVRAEWRTVVPAAEAAIQEMETGL